MIRRVMILLAGVVFLGSAAVAQDGTILYDFPHEVSPFDEMGGLPGAAMFDYDNDGDLDVYVANGHGFRNYLLENDGSGKFTDVSRRAGVNVETETHGVASADIDNDGDADLFAATDGRNYLFLNNGDGTFSDITESAGIVSRYFSSTVAFADVDNDGYVDIYIGGAGGEDGVEMNRIVGTGEMYVNNGDLTFRDVTDETGTEATYTWSARFCDYDDDGDPDLFTANDQGIALAGEWSPIRLHRNDGNLRFTDVTREAGLGITGSWMGLAFGDYDLDGDFDLFATNVGGSFVDKKGHQEYDLHGFFRNDEGVFRNIAEELVVAQSRTLAKLQFGWGTVFTDFDNDGDLDLYYVGNFDMLQAYDNPGYLLINDGTGAFRDSTARFGLRTIDGTDVPTIAVGVAAGDVNDDGHVDIFVANAGTDFRTGYPMLFTEKFDDNNWIRLKLEGTESNRSAIGARIRLFAGGGTQIRDVASGGSSFSQNSLWPTFGIGGNAVIDSIEIRWPSGIVQTIRDIEPNQTLEVLEERPPPVVVYADPRADFNGDGSVDFGDFIALTAAFNTGDSTYDLNGDNVVDFTDFIEFTRSFGRPLPS
ncbi:MAG: FG-GAP-like repeat-containing protein [Gemmatimonadota bacterium]|nr:FG-GAP-like repeat-containing protein [Gemmatimonadota bacterium]